MPGPGQIAMRTATYPSSTITRAGCAPGCGPLALATRASRLVGMATVRRSARPSRDDHERSALTLKPCAAANAAAVSPLARQAATRDRRIVVLSDIDEHDEAR